MNVIKKISILLGALIIIIGKPACAFSALGFIIGIFLYNLWDPWVDIGAWLFKISALPVMGTGVLFLLFFAFTPFKNKKGKGTKNES